MTWAYSDHKYSSACVWLALGSCDCPGQPQNGVEGGHSAGLPLSLVEVPRPGKTRARDCSQNCPRRPCRPCLIIRWQGSGRLTPILRAWSSPVIFAHIFWRCLQHLTNSWVSSSSDLFFGCIHCNKQSLQWKLASPTLSRKAPPPLPLPLLPFPWRVSVSHQQFLPLPMDHAEKKTQTKASKPYPSIHQARLQEMLSSPMFECKSCCDPSKIKDEEEELRRTTKKKTLYPIRTPSNSPAW